MRHLQLVTSLFAGVVAGPLIGLAAAPAPRPGDVHLVIAPKERARAIVLRAGGAEVAPVAAPLAVLAASTDPDFADRLRRAGAWLVLDGQAIARLCGVPT